MARLRRLQSLPAVVVVSLLNKTKRTDPHIDHEQRLPAQFDNRMPS